MEFFSKDVRVLQKIVCLPLSKPGENRTVKLEQNGAHPFEYEPFPAFLASP
jgi:hypothetical protein